MGANLDPGNPRSTYSERKAGMTVEVINRGWTTAGRTGEGPMDDSG